MENTFIFLINYSWIYTNIFTILFYIDYLFFSIILFFLIFYPINKLYQIFSVYIYTYSDQIVPIGYFGKFKKKIEKYVRIFYFTCVEYLNHHQRLPWELRRSWHQWWFSWDQHPRKLERHLVDHRHSRRGIQRHWLPWFRRRLCPV